MPPMTPATVHPSPAPQQPLRLTPLQAAALQESGINRHFLAKYLPQTFTTPVVAAPPASAAPDSVSDAISGPASVAVSATPHSHSLANLAADILQQARQQKNRHLPPAPPSAASTGAIDVPVGKFEVPDFVLPDWAANVLAQPNGCFELMVISESPGLHDETHARPAHNRMGTLLQAMLKAAGVTPQTPVFHTHLLALRPALNQGPTEQALAAGMARLRQQIVLLRPRRLLVLGQVAAQAMLGPPAGGVQGDDALQALRGRSHIWLQDSLETPQENPLSATLVATYAPAVLLARPHYKAAVWQDLNLLALSRL